MQIYHDSFILNHIWFDLKSVRTEWLAELVQVEVLELTGQRLRLGWSRWPTNATATSVHICYIASGWPQEKFPILSMELTLNFTLNLTKLDKLWHWEHLITIQTYPDVYIEVKWFGVYWLKKCVWYPQLRISLRPGRNRYAGFNRMVLQEALEYSPCIYIYTLYLPPWCGGGVVLSSLPPVVWWGCCTACIYI